jgi:two-component system OmpR family response regulator
VIEDEPRMATILRRSLEGDGHAVVVAERGDDGLALALVAEYDVIVLDVMLPGLSGFEVCRRLRARECWTPIMLLTARDATTDRVEGLDGGADDYLVKPFTLPELHARLRSLTRRAPRPRPSALQAGDLTLNPATHEVRRGRQPITLAPAEFKLLEALIRNSGIALSRAQLLDLAWDSEYEGTSNVVDASMRRLRSKVDEPFGRSTIQTVRGVGYRLCGDA